MKKATKARERGAIHGAEHPDDFDRTKKPPVEAWAILCNPSCVDFEYIAFGERMFITREKCAAYIKAVCNSGERPIKVRITPILRTAAGGKRR